MKKSCFKGCFCSKAFTLIELLVVVLIIGILAAVALPQYKKAVYKSRYVQLQVAGDAIMKAEQAYYLANGKYSDDLNKLDLSIAHEHFRLYLDIGASSPTNNAIVLSNADKLGYVIYLGKNIAKECRVHEDKLILHNICKSISQNETYSSCGNTCYAYRIK